MRYSTPGPWRIESQPPGDEIGMVNDPALIVSDDGTIVAEACGGIGFAEQDANARLVAAAPRLVAALATLLGIAEADCMDDKSNVWRSAMLDAQAALDQASSEENQRHSDGGRCCECDSPDHECDECPVFD